MGEIVGQVIRTIEKEKDRYGKIPVSILLAVGSEEAWYTCWDSSRLVGMEQGGTYTFETKKKTGKDDRVFDNIVGFANAESNPYLSKADEIDRQQGKSAPQTHTAPSEIELAPGGYRYYQPKHPLDRESIERQTSLKEAVSVWNGAPWLEGETIDFTKPPPVILEMAAIFLEFIQNSPESVIIPDTEGEATPTPPTSPSTGKQKPLASDSEIGVNEFWREVTALAKAKGQTAPDLATAAMGMAALSYAEEHSWADALEAVKAYCEESKEA